MLIYFRCYVAIILICVIVITHWWYSYAVVYWLSVQCNPLLSDSLEMMLVMFLGNLLGLFALPRQVALWSCAGIVVPFCYVCKRVCKGIGFRLSHNGPYQRLAAASAVKMARENETFWREWRIYHRFDLFLCVHFTELCVDWILLHDIFKLSYKERKNMYISRTYSCYLDINISVALASFSRGHVWPSLLPACLSVCICLCVNPEIFRAITHHLFQLEPPNRTKNAKHLG